MRIIILPNIHYIAGTKQKEPEYRTYSFRPLFKEIAIMKILQIKELTDATVVCGNTGLEQDLDCAFASDLMSDVLTLDCNEVILITGLCNLQAIRTAEMADLDCILFVRGKKVTPEMLQLASENGIILLETNHSMYHTVGELYSNGLVPVY